jgi:ferritin-like protein
LDTTDENYTLHGHFTKEELKEINAYKPAILPDIPDDVAENLRSLNAVSY